MASLKLEGIEKHFGAHRVLKGISLDVPDGAFVSLVGPSGCGKSTLLRIIAGLERCSAGRIHIGSRLVNHLPSKKRDIAMVFQNYALYPHMTVRENITFALRLAKTPVREVERKLHDAAAILNLEQLLDRHPRQLSGGQRQRVAMGRAIVRDPDVFLFDEPLSNLDAKLRVSMRGELKALHQELGSTMIYVTHDQIEAMTMSDLVVVMNAGEIVQTGAPLSLYDAPADIFVAGFIGSPAMNLFNGQVDRDAPDRFVTEAGNALPVGPGFEPLAGRPAVYGIRPEHIALSSDNGLDATAELIEPTGAETFVRLNARGEILSGLFRDRISDDPGRTLRIGIDGMKAHMFDRASGQRLSPAAMRA